MRGLEVSRVRLRELERGDLERINRWRNDTEVIQFLGANFLFIGQEVDEKWFERYLANRERQVRLSILDAAGEHVGNVNLTDVHPINRSAEFSIVIGEKRVWEQGLGKLATQEVLRHAFADLNLNRVYLWVLVENARAIGLYEKVGFKREGIAREAVFKNGSFCDLQLMSVLKKDFVL